MGHETTRCSANACSSAIRDCSAPIKTTVPARTHLLRQMMSADVEGSLAAFFDAPPGPLAAGGGVDEALPLGGASACALFFLRAMFQSSLICNPASRRLLLCCGFADAVSIINFALALASTEPVSMSPTRCPCPAYPIQVTVCCCFRLLHLFHLYFSGHEQPVLGLTSAAVAERDAMASASGPV